MMATTQRSRSLVVAVLLGTVVGLAAGCGGSSSNTQTGTISAMQVGGISLGALASGTVSASEATTTGVTVTTSNGKQVAASVPASLAHSLRLRQVVEIKKVSGGKWEVTRIVKQAPSGATTSGASTSPATSTSQAATNPSPTTSPSTPATATAPAGSVKACIQGAGFTVAVKPLSSTDRNLGVGAKWEVTTPSGELHTVDIWKTPADASQFARNAGDGYRAFGSVTVQDAGTADAKKIEACLH